MNRPKRELPLKVTKQFREKLLKWHENDNHRQMPWKGEKDPYKIWLSEIILQQTRVNQGLAYYNRFVSEFPTVQHLAAAPETQVFKAWEGLGYYSRCRNLIQTAKTIVTEFGGAFPADYPTILTLKGIGRYTAAAIASFAFNLPHAVVDGNVIRVLARYLGIYQTVDTAAGKMLFAQLAQQMLDAKQPGVYNQAIMDFGATCCKPSQPDCGICPLQTTCYAFTHNAVAQLPVKEKALEKKPRQLCWICVEWKQNVAVRPRQEKDIWQGLHEYWPVLEPEALEWTPQQFKEYVEKHSRLTVTHVSVTGIARQTLSHQRVTARLCYVKAKGQGSSIIGSTGLEWVNAEEHRQLAFPKILRDLMEEAITTNGA